LSRECITVERTIAPELAFPADGRAAARRRHAARRACTDLSDGIDLLETSAVKRLTGFANEWSDLMEQEKTPVVEVPDLAR
jgi:hypothetical protein